MLGTRRPHLVIGLTTYNYEMLRISVPAIARIRDAFVLIVHNDNPNIKLTKKNFRDLGYRGPIHIINSDTSVGTMAARFQIARAASQIENADWITYVDDDDILTSIKIPNISTDNFIIIKNAIIIRHQLLDVLRAMDNPHAISPDGENITLLRPNVGIVGNPIRTAVMCAVADIVDKIHPMLDDIFGKIPNRMPTDLIMWEFINTWAHNIPNAPHPIYMDEVSYIANKIDTPTNKYGKRTIAPRGGFGRMITNAVAGFAAAMVADEQ